MKNEELLHVLNLNHADKLHILHIRNIKYQTQVTLLETVVGISKALKLYPKSGIYPEP